MDGFKNPETYEKLKSLGIVDLDPTEFSGDELSHHLSHRLANYEFTADELDNPLEGERRLHLQDAVNTAVVIAATNGHYDDKTRAEMELSRIRSLSSLMLSSTRLKDMEPSQAKAYHEGHGSHEEHFSDTLRNVKLQSKSSSTESIPYSYEGGPVYYRIVDTSCNIANCWRTLPGWLGVDQITEGMPQAVFDALGKALVQYKALIGQMTDGITQQGIPQEMTEQTFRSLFVTHRLLFKWAAERVIDVVEPLGADKVKKAQEWISSTDAKLTAAHEAVGFTDSERKKSTFRDEKNFAYID